MLPSKKQITLIAFAILVTTLVSYGYWDLISFFARTYEPQLKILSLILGPIATIIGFYLGYRSKEAMAEHSAASEQLLVKRSNDAEARLLEQSEKSRQDLLKKGDELSKQAAQIGMLGERIRQAEAALGKKSEELNLSITELHEKERRMEFQNRQIRQLSEGSQELWRLRAPNAFAQYASWLRDPVGAKLVTIGNLKGGVGKTTIAANFAAYLSETRGLNVLLIDLDYQGSLSNMMLLAAGVEDVESRVESLFAADASLATLMSNQVHLAGQQNAQGGRMSRAWIVPSNYPFAAFENRLLFQYVVDDTSGIDLRFRLAHTLLHPDVRRRFAVVLFDMPPRLTMGSVNALFASHYFVVPTILDKLSGEAVSRFLSQVKDLKKEAKIDLDFAGFVGTLTRSLEPSAKEREILGYVTDACEVWDGRQDTLLGTVPRRQAIASSYGEQIPYLLSGNEGEAVRNVLDPLFIKICERIGL
jgi:cellulose biosynthesis protein BcsQ